MHPKAVSKPLNIALALVCTLAVSGCKSNSIPATKVPIPAAKTAIVPAPVDPATAGTLVGAVLFKGVSPARVKIDMSMDPACSLAPGDNLSEQYLISGGHLANVFLYIKSGLPAASAPASTQPVRIDQKGCRYIPHVAAVQQGAPVEFTNSDPTMHNVHTMATGVGNPNIDVSQGPNGEPQTRRFNAPETMLPMRCNNHPWMQALLNVAPNPYFAVTAADGSFSIPNLPPGTYTLAAVHEKLGEQDTQITITPHGTVKTSLTFSMP